jgi:hypothetical protein
MRMELRGILLAALLATGCESGPSAPPADDAAAGMRQAIARAAAERKPATEAGGAALAAALPGGVLPGFDHVVGSDMSSKAGHTTRIVMLRARNVSASDALAQLAGRFSSAGFESGSVSSGKDSLLQGFWTPGEGRGVMVVSTGGTHVGVVARDFPPDSESAREGYSAMVVVTVNSP